jgi:hypothetical protein
MAAERLPPWIVTHVALVDVPPDPACRTYPDFRDSHREYQLMPHEIAQQDGFPDAGERGR